MTSSTGSPHSDAHHHGHTHAQHPGHAHSHGHAPFLAQLLELDAHVNSGILTEATARLAELSGDPQQVRRVLDIGAGTGTGSIALAHQFPAAEIVAIDINGDMLQQVRINAEAAGLGERIQLLQADIAAAEVELGTADLVWSAAALHEVGDPAQTFRNLFEALRPGGWLAVIEMDAPPRLLPAEFAEFEAKLHTTGPAMPSVDHPDWSAALAATGFEVLPIQKLNTDQTFPADGPAGEFAALELRRLGHAAMSGLPEAERNTLLQLTGDGAGNVRTLGELWIRGSRSLWAARRP
ncbi:class I SAM-dependent methyltransferase [Corynebacterium sp. A21]|uniref:class I SAM-dependent methyltransferase n=1 Tax=Corynebacterium sp. A21 TaxID=3457318 RepID=UPI003FCF7620